MDWLEQIRSFISAVMKPCKIPPKDRQPFSFTKRPRTRISRSQVLAIGVMSITMMGILATSQLLLIPPIHTQSPIRYDTESVIVKFDSNGLPVWDVRIPIANDSSKVYHEPYSIEITRCRAGGYALVSPILCNDDKRKTWGIFLCRLDDLGQITWNHTIDGLEIEPNLALVESESEELVVAGTSRFFEEKSNSWIRRVFLICLNSKGETIWDQVYQELTGVQSRSLVLCSNGDLALVGTSDIYSPMKSNICLSRIADNGTLLWTTMLGSSMNDEGNSLLECDDGGFVVVGSYEREMKDKDVLLFRTTSDGKVMWNRTYEDEGNSIGLSICSIEDVGFAITGLYHSRTKAALETLFLKIRSNGELINQKALHYSAWTHPYGRYSDCSGHAIVQSDDEGFIIAGSVKYHWLSDERGMMILKTDAKGNLISNSTYGNNSWHIACSLTTCYDNGFVVAGVKISQRK